MKKFFGVFFAAAALSAVCSMCVSAQGWVQENNNWVYYENSGSKATNTWKTSSDGGYYYLDGNGNMVVNSFIDEERYVGSDGRMVNSVWRQIDSKWYYFDSNGKTVKDKSKQINGVYYFFGDDGSMQTGWVYNNSNWYYCDPSDGHMYVSCWQQLTPSEDMSIDESSDKTSADGTYWFYFQSGGKAAKADSGDYKEYTINGNRYAFDMNGCLQTGWVQLSETTPKIAGFKYYNDDASLGTYGAAHVGWLSTYPPENQELGSDVVWYYFDSRGVPAYGTDVSISDDEETLAAKFKRITKNGKTTTYLFNVYGNPVYGLRKVMKKDGSVTSMYFGTKQECCLQLGEKSITDADGTVASFHFESNGYGTNGIHSNKLYYMGKLQKALDDDHAFYTVNGATYLVNKSGTIVKNYNSKKDSDEVDYKSDASGKKSGGTADVSDLDIPAFEMTDIS